MFGFILKALFSINYLTKVHSIHNCPYLHLDGEQLIVLSRLMFHVRTVICSRPLLEKVGNAGTDQSKSLLVL